MKKKIVLGILAVILISAGGIYYYDFIFGAKHKDPLKSEDKIVIKAADLFGMYSKAEDSANKLYLDSVISVSGMVQKIELNGNRYTITMETGDSSGAVICEMDQSENEKLKALNTGMNINVVGFCNGLLIDVQLDRCKLEQ